eukprot:UN11085
MGNDCSFYTEQTKNKCGRYNIRGHRFTAETQCCVCRKGLKAKSPYYEQNTHIIFGNNSEETNDNPISSFLIWLEGEPTEHLIVLGMLAGMIVLVISYACCHCCGKRQQPLPALRMDLP